MYGRFACMHACIPRACSTWKRPEEGVKSPGVGVIKGCEPLCEHDESKLGPQQEQPVLLTPELSLQLLIQ